MMFPLAGSANLAIFGLMAPLAGTPKRRRPD
jgi:hypothetical protein